MTITLQSDIDKNEHDDTYDIVVVVVLAVVVVVTLLQHPNRNISFFSFFNILFILDIVGRLDIMDDQLHCNNCCIFIGKSIGMEGRTC